MIQITYRVLNKCKVFAKPFFVSSNGQDSVDIMINAGRNPLPARKGGRMMSPRVLSNIKPFRQKYKGNKYVTSIRGGVIRHVKCAAVHCLESHEDGAGMNVNINFTYSAQMYTTASFATSTNTNVYSVH